MAEDFIQQAMQSKLEVFESRVSKLTEEQANSHHMTLTFSPREVLEHLRAGDAVGREFFITWMAQMLVDAALEGDTNALAFADSVGVLRATLAALAAEPRTTLSYEETP